MEFNTATARPEAHKADAIAVGVWADGKLTPAAAALDKASKGALSATVKSGDMNGRRGSLVTLRGLAGVTAPRVVLVGLGGSDDFGDRAYSDAVRAAAKACPGIDEIAVAATEWTVAGRDAAWQACQFAIAARETVFRSDELKSKKEDSTGPKRATLLAGKGAAESAVERGLKTGTAIANGMAVTKRLGNLPPNICTPSFLGDEAKKLAKQWKLDCDVLETKQIEALKMKSFLNVAKGSALPPRLIVLKHNGGGKSAPVVLVGKGLTFDSGGISIKPAAAMDEMKYDMCGAASVIGTLRAVAELKLKLNVVGVIGACENMPSGTATKPGDIVTSMSGQSIEVLNTDAEGRLVLCDLLTYVEKFKPAAVVDIATLTGACVIALGNVNSGLFSNKDSLAEELLKASRAASDPAWHMPLGDEYQEQLKSNFADIANIGTPSNAGAITAACFLARFTKAYTWAHLDIAGTAWKSGAAKGATGRPVPLLSQFLIARAG